MATGIPHNPTTGTINQLLQKLTDTDPDFRFMSLNDLLQVLAIAKPDILQHDYNTAARTVDHLIKALDDPNGEVQNLAIKCLGPLVIKLPNQIIGPMMEKLSTLKLENSVDNTVTALALRSVIEALPRPALGATVSKEAYEAYASISRVLIPRLLGRAVPGALGSTSAVRLPPQPKGILENDVDLSSESIDILIEVLRCFGSILQDIEIEALKDAVVAVLEKDRATSVVKKRAVVAVSILAVYLSDRELSKFIKRSVGVLRNPTTTPVTERLYITIMGSMARSIPNRFGKYVDQVLPLILQPLNEEELQKELAAVEDGNESDDFNDVREASLVALEAVMSSCPNQLQSYTDEIMDAALRYLRYDPNYAMDDEDEEMEEDDDGFDDEMDDADDFEADGGFDDDDDASWKVRRCAAKVLFSLISTRNNSDLLENGVFYDKAAPVLIKRFEEREENVRLEVISALSLLIRKTGEGTVPSFSLDNSLSNDPQTVPLSRKRRRQSSGGGTSLRAFSQHQVAGLVSPTLEKVPATGPRADLAEKTPAIVKAVSKLLRGKLIPTKQAAISLLNDLIAVQRGGLSDYLEQVILPVLEAAAPASGSTSTSSGNASATAGTLRVIALRFLGHITQTHSSQLLQPYITKVLQGVLAAVHDRFYKISGAAIQTLEEVIKAITPPRAGFAVNTCQPELEKSYDVLLDRTAATDVDAEVRQTALHALATLLSRTSTSEGSSLLSTDKRQIALNSLLERLKNETTRLAAVRAVDIFAASTSNAVRVDPSWSRQVAVELSGQLRKSNRALRGSSLQALRHLIMSPAGQDALDTTTISSLVTALEPIINNDDTHMLGPALRVLADLVQTKPQLVATPAINSALCQLLKTSAAGSVIDPILQLITEIGASGHGQPLMAGILQDVGVDGDPAIVGKVIGNLLVSGGKTAGVTIESFVTEVQKSRHDPNRASLGLAVLGEAGLKLGKASKIKPALFLEQFHHESDKVSMSAAVALGRAGAGDVKTYMPTILDAMKKNLVAQYLLLQSIKEILQQAAHTQLDISAYAAGIWDKLLAATASEDNKAVCAECIGRLTVIDPHNYAPKLQTLLSNADAGLRAITIQALRYTLSDSGDAFDLVLKDHLINMLNTMLRDPELEIRRLAMTALNSAAHNKPELIFGHLTQLMPYVMAESKVRPELVREVQMGPFKHMVDDGLEVRKGAYETLYALMETAFSRISIVDLYDRIVDGLGDDNDIRALSNLMVSKLVYIAPEETVRRLDPISEKYRATLSTKLKDTAVKQELEKRDEANKSVLRVTLLLGEKLKAALNSNSIAGDLGGNTAWQGYWEWVNKDFSSQLKTLRDESKEGVGIY